jgi:hypothetical protein
MKYDLHILTTPNAGRRMETLLGSLGEKAGEAIIHERAIPRLTIGWKVKAGYLDQYKKYVSIYFEVVKAGRPALILEDDAIGKPGWAAKLAKPDGVPRDFDYLFVSDDVFDHPLEKVSDEWARCRWSKTTCATIVSPRGAEALLKRRFLCTCAMDWTMNHVLAADPSLQSYWHLSGLFIHGSRAGMYPTTI